MFSETIRYFWSNGESLKNKKTSTLWLAASLFDVWLNELCSLAEIWSSPASEASLLLDCFTQPPLFYILIVTSIGALKNNIWEKKSKWILVKAKLLDNKIFSWNKSRYVSVIKTYRRMKILMAKKIKSSSSSNQIQEEKCAFLFFDDGWTQKLPQLSEVCLERTHQLKL